MATVMHRTTGEVRTSVHSPDYDPDAWLHNPAMPDGVDAADRIVDGDTVREMTSAEKEARDTQRLAGAMVARVKAMQAQAEAFVAAAGYPPNTAQAAQALYSHAIAKGYATREAALQPVVDFSEGVMARFSAAKHAVLAITIQTSGSAAQALADIEAVEIDLSGLTAPQVDVSAQATVTE